MECADRFDLTGRTFGKLTAISCAEGQRSRAVWECRCECGSVKRVSYHNLVNGCTKSCGCARRAAKSKDLTGQTFGRLTVVGRGEGTGAWKCRCECGGEATVRGNSLLSGNTRSCGCLQSERKRAAYRDLAGRRFGRLIALEPVEARRKGSVVWRCRCDCGQECEHPAKTLAEGRALSCGCLRHENESLQKSLHYVDGTCVEFVENAGKLRRNNTSGYPGLKLVREKWQVRITFKKKTYYLGAYADKAEAIRVRKEAEQRMFGEFLDWYNAEFPDKPTLRQKRKAGEEEKSNPSVCSADSVQGHCRDPL